MKTLSLRNFDSTIDAKIQVDIFSTNAELLQEGFETRFTNMHIGPGYKEDNAAIKLIGQVQEIEQGWQSLISFVKGISGIGLYVNDQNDNSVSGPAAQVMSVALSGTSGTANINVDGVDYLATFTTDLDTSADNFVTSHNAALTVAGITVTHPNADGVLVFTADVDGVEFEVASIINATGDLTGTVNTVTGNVTANGEVCVVAPTA